MPPVTNVAVLEAALTEMPLNSTLVFWLAVDVPVPRRSAPQLMELEADEEKTRFIAAFETTSALSEMSRSRSIAVLVPEAKSAMSNGCTCPG